MGAREKYLSENQINMMRITPSGDELHSHDFFELVYVTRGSAVHYLGAGEMELHQGDFFVIDTGTMHCYQKTRDFQIVNCLFLPEYVDRALVHCPSLSALLSNRVMRFGVPVKIRTADRIFRDEDGRVLRLIEEMEAEYREAQTGYMELLRCKLTEILVYAVRASDLAEQKRRPHEATVAMAEYLRRHYGQPLSLDLLGRRLGYSPQYLSSVFRRDTGVTLQEYLQRLRVEEAERLLQAGTLPLSVIAQQVGYSDSKHFAKVFSRYKGVAPSLLRRRFRSGA